MLEIAFLRPTVRILKFPGTPHRYFLCLQASAPLRPFLKSWICLKTITLSEMYKELSMLFCKQLVSGDVDDKDIHVLCGIKRVNTYSVQVNMCLKCV